MRVSFLRVTPGWLAHTHCARDPCFDKSVIAIYHDGGVRIVTEVTVVTQPLFFGGAGYRVINGHMSSVHQ